MVKFVFGGTGSGKSEYVFREIDRILRESDKRVCLIVPEPYTVTTEAKLARRFSSAATLRLEGTNFTRLADSVARRVGGLSYSRLTKGGRMLLLWRSMMSVWPSLGELNKVDAGDGVGLIPTLFAADREITAGGVTPEMLSAAADALSLDGTSTLAGRAHDLAVICAAAATAEAEEFDGVDDPVCRLAKTAAESGYFDNTCVFVDSFYSLTGAQKKVISEIIRCADDVTFTIPMESRRAVGVHLEGVTSYYNSALSAALRHGDGKPEFVELEGNYRGCGEGLKAVQAHLWNYEYAPDTDEVLRVRGDSDSVRIYSAADRYEEAEALCSEISRLVREGARYSDIAVACADVSVVRGICDSALRRHGIPCFISAPSEIVSSPAVRLILSLLRIPGKWRREDIISLVKTGLSPLSDELACTFESYTDTWNIRGKRAFTSPWSMNPDGYREELSERARTVLLDANEARDVLISPIERFTEIFENGKTDVKSVCCAIVEFFEESGAYKKLMHRADLLEAGGAADDAARERLVWGEICSAFDLMVEIIGDVPVDAAGFASLFRYAVSDADTGAIPTGVDVVTVASAASLRTDGVKHMILLGAVAGEFPASVEDKGYFSDDDRRRLAEVGIILSGDVGEKASEELFRFYRAVSQAAESLTVFVPKSSGGTPVHPSEGASRILSIIGRDEPTPFKGEAFDKLSLDNMCNKYPSETLSELRRELFGEEKRKIFEDAAEATVSKQTALEVFGNRMSLSQSRIDTYVKCPMSYYCTYVLRLSEDRKAEISAPDIGTFVHAVLEELLKYITKQGEYLEGEALESLCDEIIGKYIRKTCGNISDGRMSYLFLRLRRQVLVFAEAIVREASQSRFETYATELPVGIGGAEGSLPAISFPLEGGGEVSLRGYIDRMDVYRRDGKTYIRVIDYKTGSTRFSYDDVKIGLNIQLLIYLFSSWRGEGTSFHRELDRGANTELVPAGALYFNLKPADMTSDKPLSINEARDAVLDSMERSGVVTDDRDVLDAMDRGITGKYVPVSLKADGSYKKSASLATLERFGELYREMEIVICRIASEMKSGAAGAVPLEHHGSVKCDWCPLHGVCRREAKR